MRPLVVIPFLASLSPILTLPQDKPAGTWLDSPTVQWNSAGASLPKPPQDVDKNDIPEYCKKYEPPPLRFQEERIVASTGWLVFASFQGKGGVTVVAGAVSVDGMCRPDPYQYFVFVQGGFAGTLSPRFMNPRSDGSLNKVSFPGRGKIVAAFSRYTAADPLCCPSRISEATYEVRQESGKPVVMLVRVQSRR